jgi:hypothetical protein
MQALFFYIFTNVGELIARVVVRAEVAYAEVFADCTTCEEIFVSDRTLERYMLSVTGITTNALVQRVPLHSARALHE